MSVASSDGGGLPSGEATVVERRGGAAERLDFEALVEVNAATIGGFEAESVNVSPDGIRMRTAYLPAAGETLVCRFDGFGGEVVAQGQVAWARHEERGGEFGVRFTNLDDQATGLLRSMCGPEPEVATQPTPEDPSAVQPGTRVRLHIHGLGSPMRARVRDAATGEVLIGSNLEFLRVGQDVELEDIHQRLRRTAQIEHVGVDIDPETDVPQLIVALRYLSPPPSSVTPEPTGEEITAPYHRPTELAQAGAGEAEPAETTPEPTVIDEGGERISPPPAADAYAPGSVAQAAPPLAQFQPAMPQPAPPQPAQPYAVREPSLYPPTAPPQMAQMASSVASPTVATVEQAPMPPEPVPPEPVAVEAAPVEPCSSASPPSAVAAAPTAPGLAMASAWADKVAPALTAAGTGAKTALQRIVATVQEKRAQRRQRAQAQKAAQGGVLRTTAPPPSGALRSDGRRLFRDVESAQAAGEAPLRPTGRSDRKRAIFGAVVGILAVLSIYAVASHLSKGADEPPAASAVTAAEQGQAVDPALIPPPPPGAAGDPAIASANVPLFGATPLSTTEPVPAPPDPQALGEQLGEEPPAGSKPAKPAQLEKEWGVGSVNNPTVLRLKMDGPIEGISGSETATGFTIVVPNRKSVSSAAGLSRKHKRLDSVNVVNYPDRAEITLRFDGQVPAYTAKISGRRLIIEISNDKGKSSSGDKKKSDKSKSSGSRKKKSSSGKSGKRSGKTKR